MNDAEQQSALDAALRGDTQARGQLLDSYRPYVRFLVRAVRRGRVSNRLDDSDLIQDALVEVHRHFDRFRGATVAELTAWLRPLVLRVAGRALRRELGTSKRDAAREEAAEAVADQLVAPGSSPSAQAMRQEEIARLARGLSRLPEDMQQVLLGRHADGLPHAVLAEQLGRTEAAVRVLYTRALRRLREECSEP